MINELECILRQNDSFQKRQFQKLQNRNEPNFGS